MNPLDIIFLSDILKLENYKIDYLLFKSVPIHEDPELGDLFFLQRRDFKISLKIFLASGQFLWLYTRLRRNLGNVEKK